MDLGKLPSPPHVLLKLLESCQRADVSFDEVAGILKQDAALCAKVMDLGNSAAFAQWNSLKEIDRLLVILGLNTVKTIAITSAIHHFFSRFKRIKGEGQGMGKFWLNSLHCAHTASALAKLTGYESAEEAYLAGLLHHLGQLVYLNRYPEEYSEMLLGAASDTALDSLEREQLGATSSEIGAYLTRDWAPESFLSDALLFQHEPAEAILDAPHIVKLLNLAHKLTTEGGEPDKAYEEADRLFELTQPVVDELRTEVRKQVAEAASDFGIEYDNPPPNVEDEESWQKMGTHVQGFAVMHGLGQQSGSAEQQAPWPVVLRNLSLLFGLSKSLAFEYRADTNTLNAVGGYHVQDSRLSQLSIKLLPGRSLVSEALLRRSLVTSGDEAMAPLPSVVDQQLMRLLGSEHLFCIPLIGDDALLGVVAAGIDPSQVEGLQKQRVMVEQFAQVASASLSRQQQMLDMFDSQRSEQLIRTRRLVHEAGNPLGIIKNYLHLLSMKLGEDQALQEQLTVVKEEIDRVAGILLRMKDTDAPVASADGLVDINQLISDLIGVYRGSIFATHNIRDNLRLGTDIQPLKSNANSLKQVLTNLVKNAVEAMPEGGTLTITSRDQVNLSGRPHIELRIADTGPGLPPVVLEKAFTPVKSTKGEKHSGLGLTIVSNLVTDLEGTISCGNQHGGGAEFVVLFPRT